MAKILVVEDESIVAMDIKNRLVRLGYDVPSVAYAGEEAVEKATKICPDLVLMDIMLRGEMDGIEAARLILERLDVPVVYLTAFSDEDTLQRAKITGPFGYIIKPFEDRELHVALEIALYKHRMEKNLKESEEHLRAARDNLEIRVKERTTELAAANKDLMEEIAERKKAEDALHHKMVFENIITALSTNFINLGLEKIDEGINDALKRVGTFSDVDRCYTFQFSDDMTKMDNTYEWCAEGIVPQIDNLKDLSIEDFSWGMDKLRLFENIYIPRVADMPPEAKAEKEILLSQSNQSLIVIPMVSDGRLMGYVGFDSVRDEKAWSDEDIKLLKIAGELLTNALRRKLVESEKARLITELGTKNAEMERFTYTVSHDLRSPLITIQGFLGFLKKDIKQIDDNKSDTDIKMIENAVKKMDALLSNTLELSRIGRVTNPPEAVSYEEIVADSLAQLAEKIRSSGISVLVAKELPQVYVDRMRIMEVLVNLIENSIKYIGNKTDPKVEIGYDADKEKPVFFVRDNGIGIDSSQHEKVFELFYKLDKKSEGSGAGLAIVKRILEVHGGLVWIESEEGEGCKICFTLPLARKI
jgi:signal transduction histidine kinase/DNA-binding response OmpR family regulator